jgi:hypothetical protein
VVQQRFRFSDTAVEARRSLRSSNGLAEPTRAKFIDPESLSHDVAPLFTSGRRYSSSVWQKLIALGCRAWPPSARSSVSKAASESQHWLELAKLKVRFPRRN